ncbi:hypothetical protein BDQ17DRAFT_1386609 [Cyathus striatus]|nr:hypothetical protein BDQ17DRAFT_1386609 [Cyathus striatus]
MSEPVPPTVHSSTAEVWYLKKISFRGKELKIITQNFNGPCSFIAICNILILRGNITILPIERLSVSYEFLSHLVADYLLTSAGDVDISAALSIMPETQKGLDLNPVFTSATTFNPTGHGEAGLKLFEQAGIPLVHGWLVDPDSHESKSLKKVQDYDNAVNLIAEADHITNGRLVVNPRQEVVEPGSPVRNYTEEERTKIDDAITVRHFLETTWSQLTYHGLFHLASTIPPGSLIALFRSSHLSVLYKSEAFLNEPSVVWERLEDVDGGSSSFVDSNFIKSSPAGEDTLRAMEMQSGEWQGIVDPADHALAYQLQAEEDRLARNEREAYLREKRRKQEEEARHQEEIAAQKMKKKKSKGDCIIM